MKKRKDRKPYFSNDFVKAHTVPSEKEKTWKSPVGDVKEVQSGRKHSVVTSGGISVSKVRYNWNNDPFLPRTTFPNWCVGPKKKKRRMNATDGHHHIFGKGRKPVETIN